MRYHNTILVTGGTGSIGAPLVKRLLDTTNSVIRVLSRNDSSQHEFDVISVCAAADQALASGRQVEVEYV